MLPDVAVAPGAATPAPLLPHTRAMPNTVTVYLCGVWFCVGLFTGIGWGLAGVVVAHLVAIL